MGNPGIFLIQPDGQLVEMNEQAYDSEDLLQTLLARYPSLLAGNQIDPSDPKRWLLIERECGVPSEEGGGGRFSADHLFLDQDAVPTFVEVKRSINTDIRRKIVGQMLDYAANAVAYWPVAFMRERFNANCNSRSLDPDSELEEFLDGRWDGEEFWQLANKNLQDRNIRLLFVADEIPKELQRIVEFLNEQMIHTEVLAIEIKQFINNEQAQTGLVPRVIGQSIEAQDTKVNSSRGGRLQNEDTFFEAMARNRSPEEAEIARQILAWSKPPRFTRISWGRATFVPVLDYDSQYSHNPISVGMKKGPKGGLGIRLSRMKSENGFTDAQLQELVSRLNTIPGINLDPESVTFTKIPLSVLATRDALAKFLDAIEWTIRQVNGQQPTTTGI